MRRRGFVAALAAALGAALAARAGARIPPDATPASREPSPWPAIPENQRDGYLVMMSTPPGVASRSAGYLPEPSGPTYVMFSPKLPIKWPEP